VLLLLALGMEIGAASLKGQGLLPSCVIVHFDVAVQLEGMVCQFTESPAPASQLSQRFML